MRGAVAGVLAVVAAVASLLGSGDRSLLSRHAAVAHPSASASSLQTTPIPRDPAALAAQFTQAQATIDNASSPAAELESAAQFEQLATYVLATGPRQTQRAVLSALTGSAAATLRGNLAAAAALRRLNRPRRSLPPWKIVAPPAPATLLGYFKSAQSRYGVPWEYLAAIEAIETDFGRVVGLSTAGAEGPMQFMPATWAAYGTGNVHDQRSAILAAARYLVANGARADMPGAVYNYNPSSDYVAAVRAYAARMTADPRAFLAYYYRDVILARVGGPVILPVGFPKVRPVPLRQLTG